MDIIYCEQGSREWFEARMGIPTASMFATVMASGKGGGESLTRRKYLYQLAGEILTGEPMEHFSNEHTERGKIMETEARDMYAFLHDEEPQQIGFIRAGKTGCSPDLLIGLFGMLEIKTKLPHLLIELLLKDEFPSDHKAQCQGGLWIAERDWIDIGVYWPKLPFFEKRAYRDEPYIKKLTDAVDKFNDELAALVHQMRSYVPGPMIHPASEKIDLPIIAAG